MNTLTLRITPDEFWELLSFLRFITAGHTSVPLPQRPLVVAVLATYLLSLTPARLYAWQLRDYSKTYALKLSLPTALALHTDMQNTLLNHTQQCLLGKLDLALTNFREPSQPISIRQLMSSITDH